MAFRQGLEDLGWEAGRDLDIEFRWKDGDNDIRAAELLALAPDLILTEGTAARSILRRQTSIIPLLFVRVPDPVGEASLQVSIGRPAISRDSPAMSQPSAGNGSAS
jgi:putative ABC transport system substrate-binding protein